MTRSAGTRIMAGATPTRTSVKANVLASAATAMSAAAMRPSPPARAWPLTRTMTGTALSTMDVRMAGMRLGAAVPRSDRSAPEQNTVPAPVSTTARTSGSSVASRNACSSCAKQAARECVAVGRRVERQRPDRRRCAARRPTRPSRVRSVGGRPHEGGKRPVVSFAGDRERRAPALPQDAPGPLRAGDRAPRRRVGGGPHLPRPRALPQAGGRRAARARVRRGLRRHGCGPHLHPHRRRGDGTDQLRRRPHGHGRADVDGDAGPGPLRVARAEGAAIWRRPSAARS